MNKFVSYVILAYTVARKFSLHLKGDARMNITVVTGNYPVNFEPNRGAFVYNLLQVLAQQHNVTVISPLKAHNWHKYRSGGYGKEKCQVIRPLSFSFSN